MKPLFARTLGTCALVALTGCNSVPIEEAGRSAAPAPGIELIGSYQFPSGARINPAQSLIMGVGDNWVGRLVLELGQGSSAAYNFFLEQYPQQGWTLVSAVRGKTSLLVFTKGERSATVELAEGAVLGGASATVTVAPRSLPPPQPARRP